MTKSTVLKIAFVLGGLASFGPLSLDMYLPAFPVITEDLHSSNSLIQLSLTFCMLGLALGQLIAGPISDKIGRKIPLAAGLILYAIASLLCAFSSSDWFLIIMRLIQGMAGAAGIVIANATARDLFSGSELTRFYTLLALINGSAPVLAPVIGGQLLRVMQWQGVFVVLSLFGVVMLLAVLFSLPETLPKERRQSGGLRKTLHSFRSLLGDRIFMGYALTLGFVLAAMFAYIAGSPFILQEIYGASPQMFSLYFAINSVGIMVASQITGRLAKRMDGEKLLAFGVGMAAFSGVALLAVTLASAPLIVFLIPLFFVVSSVGVVASTSYSLALQNQGKIAGTAAAVLGVMTFLVGGLVAPLVGIAGSSTAVPMGIVIVTAELIAVLCYFRMVRGVAHEEVMKFAEVDSLKQELDSYRH
jgi:DHA1 family bicyclomycin/chloramphenicol resistance-like MFS transporter